MNIKHKQKGSDMKELLEDPVMKTKEYKETFAKCMNLSKGEVFSYHAGECWSIPRPIQKAVYDAYELGKVSPIQRRIGEPPKGREVGFFEYMAEGR